MKNKDEYNSEAARDKVSDNWADQGFHEEWRNERKSPITTAPPPPADVAADEATDRAAAKKAPFTELPAASFHGLFHFRLILFCLFLNCNMIVTPFIKEMELEVENTVNKLGPMGINEGCFIIAQFNYLCRSVIDS